MKDLLSIKEFSALSGIETSTLRYWDDAGLFLPETRNSATNYRYYSPWQLISVHFVRILSDLNVPLKEIGSSVDDRSPTKMLSIIAQQEKKINDELRNLNSRHSVLLTRRELILDGINAEIGGVDVIHMNERRFILGPPNEFRGNEGFYRALAHFYNTAQEKRINLAFPIGAYHTSLESFLKAPHQPDFFVSVDPSGNNTTEPGNYLVGFNRGFYGELKDLPEKMQTYISENSLKTEGPVYTVYLLDEICIKNPADYICQAYVKIKK